jgi:hypothetical protein
MKTAVGIIEPLMKALIYGVLAGLIALLMSAVHIVTDSSGLYGAAYGFKLFGTYILISAAGLFIGGGILIVLSSLCKGNTDFVLNVRIAASVLVLLPFKALFGFAVGMNFYLGLVVLLLIGLFALWMIYNALILALKARIDLVKITVPVLIAVLVLSMSLFGYEVWNKTNKFRNILKKFDFNELKKELPKN